MPNESKIDWEKLIGLYYSGISCNKLAQMFGVTSSLVCKQFKKRNVVIRDKRTSNLIHKNIDWNLIQKRYLDGEGCLALSKEYNISEANVRTTLRNMGTKFRPLQKYKIDHNVFDILTPDAAYWMGFISADGCIVDKESKTNKCITINLQERDEQHLVKFRDFLKSDYPIHVVNKSKKVTTIAIGDREPVSHIKKQRSICVRSDKLTNILVDHGITPRKTYTIKVSNELANNIHFWRGVLDGDGTIADDGYFCLTSASKDFITQFSIFLGTYNLCPKIRSVETETSTNYIVGTRSISFLKHMYDDSKEGITYLDRKKSRVDNLIESGICSKFTLNKGET